MKSLATIVCLVSCVIMTSSSMGGQFAYDYESFRRKYAGLEDVVFSRQDPYEEERLARVEASERHAYEIAERSAATFAILLKEGGASDSLLSKILSYDSEVGSIAAQAQSGDLYGAYDKYAALRNFVKSNRAKLSRVACAVPRQGNQWEAGLVKRANSMLSSEFDATKFILNNGSPYARVATLGEMFRDGKTFKRYPDNLVLAGLSESVRRVLTDRSEKNRKRRNILMQVTDPIVASKWGAPNRFQLLTYADYLAKEWDGIVEDIGMDGAQTLVNDALANRIVSDTAIDTARTIRTVVRAQLAANPKADSARLVSSALAQIARLTQCFMENSEIKAANSDEPSLREIEQGMISSFAREVGVSSVNLDAHAWARKIGDRRWLVQLTAWVRGQCRALYATAVMDADGNIHYYTD